MRLIRIAIFDRKCKKRLSFSFLVRYEIQHLMVMGRSQPQVGMKQSFRATHASSVGLFETPGPSGCSKRTYRNRKGCDHSLSWRNLTRGLSEHHIVPLLLFFFFFSFFQPAHLHAARISNSVGPLSKEIRPNDLRWSWYSRVL